MSTKEFKIWLINNDLNQKQLAKKIGVTSNTITNYVNADRFPTVFVWALKGIEKND